MDLELFLVLALGIFAGFYVQTLVGFAGSLIALPILLLEMELPDAIAYISIFYLFSSAFLVTNQWKNMDRKIILQLAMASMVGVVLGIVVLAFTKPMLLKKALGLFILCYLAYMMVGKVGPEPKRRGIMGMGVLAGFFSGVFSTGGPLYVICVQHRDKVTFRATMIGILALVTLTRVPALALGGLLNLNHLKMAVLVFPVFLLAQYLGKWSFGRMDGAWFKKAIMLLLCASGLMLMF